VTKKTNEQNLIKPQLSVNALQVLNKRYLLKNSEGKVVETPSELFLRVAKSIAKADLKYDPNCDIATLENLFYNMMANLEFLPNSPTLMNAGSGIGQLSACFVLPVGDSIEEIFDAVKYTAIIQKSGGGTGFSFSRLRPNQDRVGSTGGVASGPVSFMKAFDVATDVIKQGGKRRGANLGMLRVDHPDIMEFIDAKKDKSAFNNFNLSVAITNDFMNAVKTNSDYPLINPHDGQVCGKLNATEVFNKIVSNAWETGEPGIIFIDQINEHNPTPELGDIETTNPCGEQPLLPYESCNLGSINLSKMVKKENDKYFIDWDKLSATTNLAVHFLDNVIDENVFPLPQIKETTLRTRKVGLGVMGFADLLIQLGIPYNSDEGLECAEEIMRHINSEALNQSRKLAEIRGGYNKDVDVRNATRTTIAPTGTLSIIAECSGGIEPLFALSYTKNVLEGSHLTEVNKYFEEVSRQRGFYSKELMDKIANGTPLHDIKDVPDDIKKVFVTAHDISPEYHVKMQSTFQKHTDNAVSKTVNFPNSATKEDVAKVYMMAFEEGLKGITVYRNDSRENQVLQIGTTQKDLKTKLLNKMPRSRAKLTRGITEKVTTGCGNIYVTVNSDEQGTCEVFSHLGKAGGCAVAQAEATCRMISLSLRSGVSVDAIVKQLKGIRCPSISWEEGTSILSCADAIASVLSKFSENPIEKKPIAQPIVQSKNIAGQCPDCSNLLVYQEGCYICHSCGHTKCG
jgi:ribonucleoside-diphosphate reductase alpha chain